MEDIASVELIVVLAALKEPWHFIRALYGYHSGIKNLEQFNVLGQVSRFPIVLSKLVLFAVKIHRRAWEFRKLWTIAYFRRCCGWRARGCSPTTHCGLTPPPLAYSSLRQKFCRHPNRYAH